MPNHGCFVPVRTVVNMLYIVCDLVGAEYYICILSNAQFFQMDTTYHGSRFFIGKLTTELEYNHHEVIQVAISFIVNMLFNFFNL